MWPLPDAHPPSRFLAGVELEIRPHPGACRVMPLHRSVQRSPRGLPGGGDAGVVRTTRVFTGQPSDQSEVLRSLLSFQTLNCAPHCYPISSRDDGGGGDVVASAGGLGFREASLGYRSAWAPTSASHQVMGRSVVSKDRLCLAFCHLSSHLEKYLRTCTSVHSSVGKLRFSYDVAAPFSRSLTAEFLKGSSEQPTRWLGTVLWREEEAWF